MALVTQNTEHETAVGGDFRIEHIFRTRRFTSGADGARFVHKHSREISGRRGKPEREINIAALKGVPKKTSPIMKVEPFDLHKTPGYRRIVDKSYPKCDNRIH
ncbi:Hypothetical predicted protein [Octopus vulgaris]|uniref:Uncharacterized protein n=1 Tax=Octopus vulgaris TaxID=6645 RepID=A0AA36BHS3_OCTVU|nr:Hypothetical predicted protein [Octopus vulgaris]